MEKKDETKSALSNFYANRGISDNSESSPKVENAGIPSMKFDTESYTKKLNDHMKEQVDKDLVIGLDTVKLPSNGIFYKNGVAEVFVEYLTSKDEDILTTSALIENNTALDVLLRNKIKSKDIDVDDMLTGDKNAVLIFLRASSYGNIYDVVVTDPHTGIPFRDKVDLTKFKYKQVNIHPDENLHFSVELPMRKKMVKFRLLKDKELKQVIRQAEALKESKNAQFTELMTMRLKASIVEIDGRKERDYIFKFVDAMPALDALTIRKKIDEVSPDVDMNYTFTSPAGYTFETPVMLGADFFFPKI